MGKTKVKSSTAPKRSRTPRRADGFIARKEAQTKKVATPVSEQGWPDQGTPATFVEQEPKVDDAGKSTAQDAKLRREVRAELERWYHEHIGYSAKERCFIVKRSFFYRFGGSAEALADDIKQRMSQYGFDVSIILAEEYWNAWPKTSYWEVRFTARRIPEYEDLKVLSEASAKQATAAREAALAEDAKHDAAVDAFVEKHGSFAAAVAFIEKHGSFEAAVAALASGDGTYPPEDVRKDPADDPPTPVDVEPTAAEKASSLWDKLDAPALGDNAKRVYAHLQTKDGEDIGKSGWAEMSKTCKVSQRVLGDVVRSLIDGGHVEQPDSGLFKYTIVKPEKTS